MREFCYVITDKNGMHARPAGLIAKVVKGFDAAVTISKGAKTVDATQITALMSLGIKQGDEIVISSDNDEALEALKKYIIESL